MVDAVHQSGGLQRSVDEWGLDVVGSGLPEGLMIPPGLAFVSVSAKAWKAYETATLPKFTLGFGALPKDCRQGQHPVYPSGQPCSLPCRPL